MPQLEGSGRPETLQTCALGVETTVSRLMTPLPTPDPCSQPGLRGSCIWNPGGPLCP